MTENTPSERRIDVRTLIPAQRHKTIFSLIDSLALGEGFELINDHDPSPLKYQLEVQYPGYCSWVYLEQGPDVWRIEIRRKAAA